MSDHDRLRETVSRVYTEALRRSQAAGTGCCGAEATACVPAGATARSAGYAAELEAHAGAGASSFGCGNPLAFADVRAGETVLDLGSGAGLDLLVASDRVGPAGRVIGVDMTDAMLAAARENAVRAGRTNVELRRGTIEALPVADASVDWVISNCVINLSPEKGRVFAEIARVLRPGGRLSISDITAERMPPALRDHPAAHCACVAGAIPEADYVAGLERAGLTDVAVAERAVYAAAELRALIEKDFEWAGEASGELTELLAEVEGAVASVRLTGRRP